MTLQDVLLQAGGLTQQAEGSKIEVSRIMDYDISSNKLKPIRAVVKNIKIGEDLMLSSEAQEFTLQPFDQIFVRENPDYEEAVNIVLSGEVKYPGTYSLLSKNEKIASVIQRAGGLTTYAYMDGVKMFRKFEVEQIKDNPLNIPNELLDEIVINPKLSNIYNKELLNREQLKAKVFTYDSLMYNVVYFDLQKAMSKNRSKHNLVLLEGDSVIIPKLLDVVHISGDLNNISGSSISAPFFGKRADYYVRNFAGGYSEDNKKSNTLVIYANGSVKKTLNFAFFSISPKVKPGSIIKVVDDKTLEIQRKPIDWNKAIENTMLKLTAVLTLWLLVDKVTPQE